MSAHIIRFPARNAAAIFISKAAEGGWLVLARRITDGCTAIALGARGRAMAGMESRRQYR